MLWLQASRCAATLAHLETAVPRPPIAGAFTIMYRRTAPHRIRRSVALRLRPGPKAHAVRVLVLPTPAFRAGVPLHAVRRVSPASASQDSHVRVLLSLAGSAMTMHVVLSCGELELAQTGACVPVHVINVICSHLCQTLIPGPNSPHIQKSESPCTALQLRPRYHYSPTLRPWTVFRGLPHRHRSSHRVVPQSRVLSTTTTPSTTSTLAAQTLPVVQSPHAHYPHPCHRPLTPVYTPQNSYLDRSTLPPKLAISVPGRSWWAPGGHRGSEEQNPMSRPTGAANQSPIREHDSRQLAQMPPRMSPSHPHPIVHSLQRDSPIPSGPLSLPPLRQPSNTPPLAERRPGGLAGMHSILNPQADLLEQQRDRGRSVSQMELPSPIENSPHPNLPPISRPTSVDSTQGDMMPARQFRPPRPRRARGPSSPTVHRTQSLSVLNPPTGTIDAHQSPFLSPSGRAMGVDSVASQPALPTPPMGPRPVYFSTAPTPPPTMVRNELRRQSAGFPQSGSASPIAGFSPYSQPASVASSQLEAASQQGHYISAPNSGLVAEAQHNMMAMDTERGRISMAPSGQSSIQIMTIKSQQGHHVQIPVDVQAASKVADEKRKRNAGASARFRARRKEKEKEATHSIARLEQQLRDYLEDVEFYRSERDYFKSIVYQQPGAEHHYARPPSPRLRRLSAAPSNAASSTGGGSTGSPYSTYDDEALEPERNVRRRTSTYHPPPGQTAAPLNGTGHPPSGYPTSTFPSENAPSSGMNPNRAEQQVPTQTFEIREQTHQHFAGQRPQLHDPFASEHSRYEQRNWAPATGQMREHR